jgi:large subunit ribosomal protein L3
VEFDIEDGDSLKAGDQIMASVFTENDYVDVVGTSKGKGFQGAVKRHNFRGGRTSHGSMHHRAPGSIGSSAFPSRVFPGMRMAGRMGNDRVTVKNLKIVKVDEAENLIYLRGAVPGARNAYIAIRQAKRG